MRVALAMHHAYVDEDSEIALKWTKHKLLKRLEGESGNDGHNSDVMAVFNIAGASKTASYLVEGSNEPWYPSMARLTRPCPTPMATSRTWVSP